MIWKTPIDLNFLNETCKGTLSDLLGIVFTHADDHSLTATMPMHPKLMQPAGIMHGGASCVLAETIGSIAANLCIDLKEKRGVGLELNINHLRPMQTGLVIAIATPLHLGKATQVWDIKIRNDENKLVAVSRLTVFIGTA